VEAAVEIAEEPCAGSSPDRTPEAPDETAVRVRLFGPLRIELGGRNVPLPASRKMRALLAFLLLAPRPVPRTRLCDMFWDAASDPRGELRWCLTKLRPLLDTPARKRVIASRDRVAIDVSGLDVDAIAFAHGIDAALSDGSVSHLRSLVALAQGELLEGLALDRCAQFDHWLGGERARCARSQRRALDRLAALLPEGSDERVEVARQRVTLSQLDGQVQLEFIRALTANGREVEAHQARAAAIRLFEREGLDTVALRIRPGHPVKTTPLIVVPDASLPSTRADGAPDSQQRRASIIVMPFAAATSTDADIANGLSHDVTFGLAKLRSLMVIARGTAVVVQSRAPSAQQAGSLLGVDYVASGGVRRWAGRMRIAVELAAAASGAIVWADEFSVPDQQTLELLGSITHRIVSALDNEVHLAERNRALLMPPDSLDAWQTYHRGLWHMYRFTSGDNNAAQALFARAVALDPTFSRAHAALSFTHFQNAFLLKAGDRGIEIDRAYHSASRALLADSLDPSAHWAMGRALWLRGDDDAAFSALDQSVALSPNFALGHYTLAFVHSQSGDPSAAIAAADVSQRLSPFDPLLFAIHASRVLGLLRLGQTDAAADYGRQVAGQPNAHVHARAVGAIALAAADRMPEALVQLALVRQERPRYDMHEFLAAFRLAEDLEAICRQAGTRIGIT
jgi:TolB-like protein/DNA-binding SARP family transcriptional activator